MKLRLFVFISIFLLIVSCSKKEEIYSPSKKIDPYLIYKEGISLFERNDYFNASKKFSEAELNFDKPNLAAKSAIFC